ncbi:MAG TPA: hypothetical protein PKY82_21405 [Pyrinomonadaceae bacterium]|nr:hypothetical protein [Pyrinomonadaceae bacterium]
MRIVVNAFLLSIIVSVSILGQRKLPKITSTDKSIISKAVIQNRTIKDYFDGGSFRCGNITRKGECDYQKLREIIWQCWNEKTLCYLRITHQGVDSGSKEYIFVEPNKKNQWTVIRRKEYWFVITGTKISVEDLPIVYSLDWEERTLEKKMILKDNLGMVIGEY